MSCNVKKNRHGYLALQIFWRGMRFWEGIGLPDTPDNRRLVEARAVIINAEIKTGIFDYLKHFPKGNKARLFIEPETAALAPQTIGEYYRLWIERKKPPVVRAGLARDYRDQFGRYILPAFEVTTWADLTPALLESFRAKLLTDRNLSLKSCRNIIDGSFRACCRDARTVDYVPELQNKDPFGALTWARGIRSRPDPFIEEQREKVVGYFQAKIPFYYPFIYTLFFTGMRPSEALALRWRDIDFERQELSISKSRYLGADSATKTAASEREIRLRPEVATVLKALRDRQPRAVDDDGSDHRR